jgi:hypothetical protein
MARLTIQQTAAPNFSASGQMLANAGRSLDQGLEAAKGLLGSYQEGQEATGDAALTGALAGLKNQEEYDAFIAGGGLEGLNISEGMRDRVFNSRGRLADIAGTNATTRGTDASTLLTGANTNFRNQQTTNSRDENNFRNSENADMVAGRTELRGLTAAATLADQEGRREGENTQGVGLTTDAPSSLVTTESGGNFAARNDAPGSSGREGHFGRVQFGRDRYDEVVAAGAVPPGMTIEEFGADTPEARAAQQSAEDWHFADIQSTIDSRGLDRYIGQTIGGVVITRDGIVAMAHLGGKGGAAQFLQSNGAYNPNDGPNGQGGTSLSDYAQRHAGSTTERRGTARADYREQVGNTQYQTPSQAQTLLDSVRTSSAAGQTRIDEAEAERIEGITQSTIRDTLRDSNITNDQQLQQALFAREDLGFTPGQINDMTISGSAAAANLPGVFAPTTTPDALTASRVDSMLEANRLDGETDDRTRLNDLATSFESDPVTSLVESTGIASEADGGQSRERIGQRINDYADNYGVTPGQAAAALSEVYIPNPRGFNNVENMFPHEQVVRFIDETFSPDAQAVWRGDRQRREMRDADLNGATLALSNLRTQQAKMAADDPRREGVTQEIQTIRDQLAESKTPREIANDLQSYLQSNGVSSRIAGVEPGSDEFNRIIESTIRTMEQDDQLGPNEKRLLIAALRG